MDSALSVFVIVTDERARTVKYIFNLRRLLFLVPSRSCSKAVYKPVWHIPLLSVQWINSWWWTEELSETCRVSWQNKFVKLVHLFGFITKKFVTMHGHMSRCTVTCHYARSHVTMHGHMNVKFACNTLGVPVRRRCPIKRPPDGPYYCSILLRSILFCSWVTNE